VLIQIILIEISILKKLKSTALAFLIINISSAQQTDFNNNLYGHNNEALETVPITENLDTANSACGDNTFWGPDFAVHYIREFELTNNIVTYTGNYVPLFPGSALAICNNLNGGSVSPTFYTSKSWNDEVYYWDGSSSWILCGISPYYVGNATGINNVLYFHDQNPGPIIKYDGLNFSIFFTNNKFSVADIANDNYGNIYLVTHNALISDSLYIISPLGLVIHKYSLVFNAYNAYGCFLLNNIFYIGLGPSNPVNPNTLLPVTISGSNAIMGTPIPMPTGFTINGDLASCNPGSLLDINFLTGKKKNSVFPNPVHSKFVISFKGTIRKGTIEIQNILGENIFMTNIFNETQKEINLNNISQGVYFVKVFDGEKYYCRKIIVE